jgi:hypothetical protein
MTDRGKVVELLARWPVEEYLSHRYWENNRDHAADLLDQIAPMLTAVKVKPLVWRDNDMGCFGDGVEKGHYLIDPDNDGYFEVFGGKFTNDDENFETLEAAKAAAQADYEARILAAVDAVPVAQAVEAERIACTEELRLAVAAARAEERDRCANLRRWSLEGQYDMFGMEEDERGEYVRFDDIIAAIRKQEGV